MLNHLKVKYSVYQIKEWVELLSLHLCLGVKEKLLEFVFLESLP